MLIANYRERVRYATVLNHTIWRVWRRLRELTRLIKIDCYDRKRTTAEK